MRAPLASDFVRHAEGCPAAVKFRVLVATVEQAAAGVWTPAAPDARSRWAAMLRPSSRSPARC